MSLIFDLLSVHLLLRPIAQPAASLADRRAPQPAVVEVLAAVSAAVYSLLIAAANAARPAVGLGVLDLPIVDFVHVAGAVVLVDVVLDILFLSSASI